MAVYNSNDDLIRGNDFLVYIKTVNGGTATYEPIAYAKDYSLEINSESVDTSNLMSGEWKSSLTGQKGWSVSVELLLSRNDEHISFKTLADKQIKNEVVHIVFAPVKASQKTGEFAIDESKIFAEGDARITQLSVKGEASGVASASATFEGQGELVTRYTPSEPTV